MVNGDARGVVSYSMFVQFIVIDLIEFIVAVVMLKIEER